MHNNVGVGVAGGDKPLLELTENAFDRVSVINVRGTIMACSHAIPITRAMRSGDRQYLVGRVSENSARLLQAQGCMDTFAQQLALENAPYGIRANCHVIRWG